MSGKAVFLTPDGRYCRIFDKRETWSVSFLSQSSPYRYSSKSRRAGRLEKLMFLIRLFASADATGRMLRYFL